MNMCSSILLFLISCFQIFNKKIETRQRHVIVVPDISVFDARNRQGANNTTQLYAEHAKHRR